MGSRCSARITLLQNTQKGAQYCQWLQGLCSDASQRKCCLLRTCAIGDPLRERHVTTLGQNVARAEQRKTGALLPRASESPRGLGKGQKHVKTSVSQNINFFAHQTGDGRFVRSAEGRLDRGLTHFPADAGVLLTHPAGTELFLPNR